MNRNPWIDANTGVLPPLLLASSLLALVPSALAETYLVMQDGSGDALTITGGVALATDGDSVLVGPGTYFEEVTIDASLTLLSRDGPDATTVDAGGGSRCIDSSDSSKVLVLSGFRCTGATLGYAFDPPSSAVAGSGTLAMSDCKFHDNDHGLLWTGDANVEECEAWNMSAVYEAPFTIQEGEARFERCMFHDMEGGVVQALGTPLFVKNCVFRDIRSGNQSGSCAVSVIGPVSVEGCVLQDLELGGVGPFAYPVLARPGGPRGDPLSYPATVLACTFSRVDGGAIFGGNIEGHEPRTVIHEFSKNVVTGGIVGVIQLGPPDSPGLFSCNNVWANGTNWEGLPDPTGHDGNLATPPLFCDAAVGNLTVAQNSPCLPQNNSCGVLMGALPQGCGPLSIQSESWGVIKSKYR